MVGILKIQPSEINYFLAAGVAACESRSAIRDFFLSAVPFLITPYLTALSNAE